MSAYVTVQEMRDEGVSDTIADPRLLRVIQRSSALIDRYTHRWFEPRLLTFLVDGTDSDMLLIGPPIIRIGRIRILPVGADPEDPDSGEVIEKTSYRVFNRHVQNMTEPDDRENPKVQFLNTPAWASGRRLVEVVGPTGWWPPGVQNIEVTGHFGYTEYDPDEEIDPDFGRLGKTPDLIKAACMMLASRDTLPLADLDGRVESALAGRVMKMRTRDQEVGYASSNSSTGGATGSISSGTGILGNAELMAMLASFVRGPVLGAV